MGRNSATLDNVQASTPWRTGRALAKWRRVLPFATSLGLLLVCTGPAGCRTWERLDQWASGGWMPHYDTAERAAWRSGKQLVIAFEDAKGARDRSLLTLLKDSRIQPFLDGSARCALMSSHEPDRRFVQQFSVRRAPAVVIVHSDGTYHALERPRGAEAIVEFFRSSTPPGATPNPNPLVPRRDPADWHTDIADAARESRQAGRPMLVIYERTGSSDASRMRRLLAEKEVTQRTADMVHCRISVFSWGDQAIDTPFGPLRLPALVVASPDGESRVVESPVSSEAVARFVTESRRSLATGAVTSQR